MTDKEGGSDRVRASGSDEDRVAQLLADLARDPEAPASSVTAMSVIASARAAAAASTSSAADRTDEAPMPAGPDPSADVIEFRPRRRRFALAGLVAAASLAGISALVISLTVSGGSSTSTSADGARAVSAETAGTVESPAAAAAAPPAASAAAPEAAGQAPAAADSAQDSSAAGGSAAAGPGQAADAAAPGCWPALSDPALAALTGALPTGAFGSPQPLTVDCEPDTVGGVLLPGTAPGTVLVVRVRNSASGACTGLGTPCVARGDNVYVAGEESGSPVVYAYGNGTAVVVSGWPAAGDSVPLPSGLTVDQSVAAAEAVLGALG